MIRITFEADGIADLKLKIQEYSLAHLGLKLEDVAGGLVARKVEISVKRAPGRPVGWRKKKAEVETTPEVPTPTPTLTSDESRAKSWLTRVVESQGITTGKEILGKIGVDHFDKVPVHHFDELVRLCKEALNEQ